MCQIAATPLAGAGGRPLQAASQTGPSRATPNLSPSIQGTQTLPTPTVPLWLDALHTSACSGLALTAKLALPPPAAATQASPSPCAVAGPGRVAVGVKGRAACLPDVGRLVTIESLRAPRSTFSGGSCRHTPPGSTWPPQTKACGLRPPLRQGRCTTTTT